MNWSNIESGWNEFKLTAGQQWTRITPKQMHDTLGQRSQLSLHVQRSYLMSEGDAEREISEWQRKQVAKLAPAPE
jgi:hypothetical protein